MLQQLDTAIAFVVVMLMLSLLVTAIVQAISAVLDLRGKNLVRALADMFKQIDPGLRKPRTEVRAGDLMVTRLAHPFSRRSFATEIADAVTKHPILAHTFTRAKAIRKDELLDVVKDLSSPESAGKIDSDVQNKLRDILGSQVPGGTTTLDAAQVLATKLAEQFPNAKDNVIKAVIQVFGSVSRLEVGVEKWFDTVMDRASDIFTRWMRTFTIGVSILLVVVLHIDAGNILQQISVSPQVKAGLVTISDTALSRAEQVLKQGEPAATAFKEFAEERKNTIPRSALDNPPAFTACGEAEAWIAQHSNDPSIPEAFADYCQRKVVRSFREEEKGVAEIRDDLARTDLQLVPPGALGSKGHRVSDWWQLYRSSWRHMLGTLTMVILLSLGAPFWYNALKQLSNLKPSINRRVEQESFTSSRRTSLPSRELPE